MKKIWLLLFAVFFVSSILAQYQKGYIYLKNGSVLKGKYQYSNDLLKLKVESAGNVWVFQSDEVDHISDKKPLTEEESSSDDLTSKFLLRTEIGVLAGNPDNSQSAPFSFSSELNYSVFPKFSVGAGVGLDFLKETYLPVFANFEFKLNKSYSTPYVFLKTGYEVPIEETNQTYYDVQPVYYDYMYLPNYNSYYENLDNKGGILINPGIGYQRLFQSGFGLSFAFGYEFLWLSYTGDNEYKMNIDYNRLSIKVGFIFN